MQVKKCVQATGLPRGGTTSVNSRWPLAAVILALLASLWLPQAQAAGVKHDISAGTFIITCNTGPQWQDNNNNVTNTLGMSINDFRPGSYNVADLNVQIGSSANDDTNGILIASVTENGRDNGWAATNTIYPITTIHDTLPYYRICSFTTWRNNSGTYNAGNGREYNVNVAGAWFPYSKYIGGVARNLNRANGGSNDVLSTKSPLIEWGTHYLHIAVSNEMAAGGGWIIDNGKSVLDLTSLGIDSRTDGILLVNGGKDEQNFALSMPNYDNGTWTIFSHDLGTTSASSYEQDPVAFVYIPRTNTDVVSGRFMSDAGGNPTIDMFSGDSPQFTVASAGSGRWHLRMNDYPATNGVLIISAEGGGTYNLDNIVSYQMLADASGWEIQSRDTPAAGLQSPYTNYAGTIGPERVASFVFIPAPPVGFVVTPTANLLTTEAQTPGFTNSFTVQLNAKPTANVTVDVSISDATEGLLAGVTQLVFTPADWWQPHTVLVTGVDDAEKDGQVPYTIVLSQAVSDDARYNGLKPADVGALNVDDEDGSISVSANYLTTTESGGTATFQVVLNSAPTDTVTINLASTDLTEGTVSPASIVFTPEILTNVVTVTGVDDTFLDGDITYTITTSAAVSTDANFNGVNPLDVTVVNLDNENAGLVVSSGGLLTVSEPATTANFTVKLTSQPSGNVTVSFNSSDPTEGVVSPASRTFTPANWSTPQTFTLTAVDDFVNDGTIDYTLTAAITAPSDAAYTTVSKMVPARTLDNEAVLILPSGPLEYAMGELARSIDGSATISDPDTANYNNGSLTVTITTNATSNDRLVVRHTGDDVGQIGVSGSTVTYGGMPIGTFTGGTGAVALVITFNASATPEAAQAAARNVSFYNLLATPSLSTRSVLYALNDGTGGISTDDTQVKVGLVHTVSFQNGVDGGFGVYSGAADCEMQSAAQYTPYPMGSYPDANNPTAIRMVAPAQPGYPDSVLANTDAMLKFQNIVGTAPGQIPPGSTVISAELILNFATSGRGSPLYRMLTDWDADGEMWANWGSDGVSLDNVEAKSEFYSQICVSNVTGGTTGIGPGASVSVLPDVQAWVDGDPNYGWVMPAWFKSYYMFTTNTSGNSAFSCCEVPDVSLRPRLVVKWVPATTVSTSFQEGVNGYVGTKDTSIRQRTPTTSRATVTDVYIDSEVNAGYEDPEQTLLRFDNIIGTDPGQVPPKATVHAAILHLASTAASAPGDGGTFNRMLIPWEDTSTWSNFDPVAGIPADGISAVVQPTFAMGNVDLTPNMQGGYHSMDVTADVQLWVNGDAPNYGWVGLPWPYGGDGWAFASAENAAIGDRPRLTVYYTSNFVDSITVKMPVVTQSGVQISFKAGLPDKSYYILRAPEVTGPWTTNGSATTGVNLEATYTDTAPLPGRAFYRIYTPQSP